MRSRLFVCAALASLGLIVGVARFAHAADAKAKGKKADDTDKGISKTLQWEEKVLGEDDKRAELDKILKAQAINKAATEKAEKEKAQREKEEAARAAKEAAAPKPQQKRGGEVALPALPDEGVNTKKVKSTDISPKLDTAEAAAPPPPSKPADDKFIDKLLKEEGSSKKKKVASGTDHKELLDILSTDKKAAPAKGGKKATSEVDKMLLEADKPPAPMAKIKHETPEWQKPEIQSTPAKPVVAQPAPKQKREDDGVIHVVQGAAGSSSSAPASKPAPIATRPTPAPMVPASTRKTAPSAAPSGGWNDPFADSGSRKSAASRSASRSAVEDDDFAPAPRRNAGAAASKPTTRTAGRSAAADDSWEDPFDAKKAAAARKGATKGGKAEAAGRWKDPFTDEAQPRSRGSVAMRDHRDSGRDDSTSKWEAARRAPAASDDETPSQSHGRWGVIKKRH
jgi:hypothetical protein